MPRETPMGILFFCGGVTEDTTGKLNMLSTEGLKPENLL